MRERIAILDRDSIRSSTCKQFEKNTFLLDGRSMSYIKQKPTLLGLDSHP